MTLLERIKTETPRWVTALQAAVLAGGGYVLEHREELSGFLPAWAAWTLPLVAILVLQLINKSKPEGGENV